MSKKTSFERLSKWKIVKGCLVDFILFAVTLVSELIHLGTGQTEIKIMLWLGWIFVIASGISGSIHLYQGIRYNKVVDSGAVRMSRLCKIEAQKENSTITAVLTFEDVESDERKYVLKVKKGAAFNKYVVGSLCKVKVLGKSYIVYTDADGAPLFEEGNSNA